MEHDNGLSGDARVKTPEESKRDGTTATRVYVHCAVKVDLVVITGSSQVLCHPHQIFLKVRFLCLPWRHLRLSYVSRAPPG